MVIGEYMVRHISTEAVAESMYVALCISPRRAEAGQRGRKRRYGKEKPMCDQREDKKAAPRRLWERSSPPHRHDTEVNDGDVCPARARRAINKTESAIHSELSLPAEGGNKFETKGGIEKCRWE